MEPDIVIVELHLILMSELCCPPVGALSHHPSWEPGLARAYYLEFREAWPGASRSLMDELEVLPFCHICPFRLKLINDINDMGYSQADIVDIKRVFLTLTELQQ